MKRYLYIIIGIVVVAIIAIFVILFIKNKSTNSTITGTGITGSLPSVGDQTGSSSNSGPGSNNQQGSSGLLSLPASSSTTSGQLTSGSFGILSSNQALDYFVNSQNIITAIEPGGSVITITNGQQSIVNTSTFNDIISASFSYDGKKILVSYGNPGNPQASVFDVASQTWTPLANGLRSPEWSPNSYQIAYLSTPSAGEITLSMINAASLKLGAANLLTLHANDLALKWPAKNQFVLSDKPSSYVAGSVLLFNSQTDTLTSLASGEYGVESIWGPATGTLGLVFSDGVSAQDPNLGLENLSGNTLQTFTFVTLPTKCLLNAQAEATSTANGTSSAQTASSSYVALYCGVPRTSSGFSNARLPDDYNMMALFTSDDIYEVNTASGQTQALWSDATQNIDVSDVKIFNGTLFFINRYNSELYGLVLGQ